MELENLNDESELYKYHELGSIFKYKGIYVETVTADDERLYMCPKCHFYGMVIGCQGIKCEAHERDDKNEVYFAQVEPD